MRIAPIVAILSVVAAAAACGGTEAGAKRIRENGLEVVLNPRVPPARPGAAPRVRLEFLRAIDMGGEAMAAAGIADVISFDVDPEGALYVLGPPIGKGPVVHRLSAEGKVLASFGALGQGPHEMRYPNELEAVGADAVWVLESPTNTVYAFGRDGRPIEDFKPSCGFEQVTPLAGGGFLVHRLEPTDLTQRYLTSAIGVRDPQFNLVRELDRFDRIPNRTVYQQVPEPYVSGIDQVFLGRRCGDRIVTGNSGRGYDLRVFTTTGRPVRAIRKDRVPVPVTESDRGSVLEYYRQGMADFAEKIYFPANWHPFQSFFGDDDGWLYVVTYEPGVKPREKMVDVFDRDGVLVERLSFEAVQMGPGRVLAAARGGLLYAVRETDQGFKTIAVYRIVKT